MTRRLQIVYIVAFCICLYSVGLIQAVAERSFRLCAQTCTDSVTWTADQISCIIGGDVRVLRGTQ